MQLNLGNKIRELRHRDGRTQEALAEALGVTSQAVSRWESNGGYPDMEMMPAIANFFGITMDELFGYHHDRDEKIAAIISRVESFHIKSRGDDGWVDECLGILREGLAEFPQNEKLLITLADTLSEAGWRRHREWLRYDEAGYLRHDYDKHKKNEYWVEAIKICEHLVQAAQEHMIVSQAIAILVLLYRNMGETEKAVFYANRMPEMKYSREMMLAAAADGEEEARYIGDLLLKMSAKFAEQMVYALMAYKPYFDSDLPMEKIKGVIKIFDLVCEDGYFGPYHGELIKLYLYLSRVQWERGDHDGAFVSLDQALKHAKAMEGLMDGKEHRFTAALVSTVQYQMKAGGEIAQYLPQDWPFWRMPECKQAAQEIKADPRWAEWVEKTQK